MKSGKTLVEMATELTRQLESKKDYIADTKAIEMKADEERGLTLAGLNGEDVGITNHCHQQIANRVSVPWKYYERMKGAAPQLLAENVNHWLGNEPEKRMVRTMDGNARAFLSSRYRPIDNFDLADAILPKIQEMGCTVQSAELTERRMYLKVTTDRIQEEVKQGDVVQAGLVISNSEVGAGSVRVEPLVYRLVCLNGMIANDFSLKKYHVGRQAEQLEGAVQFYSQRTISADNQAFFMKVKDIVAGTLTKVTFMSIVSQMRFAAENEIKRAPDKLVEDFSDKFTLNETERTGVLTHLIKGGDLSQYGLMNAVTRTSQDVDSYDRATELEKLGGSVLELPKHDWEKLALA